MAKLDVIVVTYRRKKFLENCINSLIKTSIFKHGNIFVVLNGEGDSETENYLQEICKKYKFVKYFKINKANKNKARNFAIKKSDAEILYFLDDDVFLSKDNIEILIKKFRNYENVDIIGGPNLTPSDAKFFERIQGYILSSRVGSYTMSQRYKLSSKDLVCDDRYLSLCNLGVRKKVFAENGIRFNEDLIYNEENYIIVKLKEKGGQVLFSPDLYVFHERRENIFSFLKQVFFSGFGRGQLTYIFPKSFRFIYLLPSLFLFLCFGSLLYKNTILNFLIFIYFSINFLNAIYLTFTYKEKFFLTFLFPLMVFLSHLSYGIGFLTGIVYELLKKK